MAVGEHALITHVSLDEAFNFPKPQFSHLPALKGFCEVPGHLRIPLKVCCRLGRAIQT